jgi:hypothetical protein
VALASTSREHVFVTSSGHAHSRFRRALLSKNLVLIEAAAAELPQVALDDALRILVVMAEKADPRFERAAARFAARVIIERHLSPAESHRVLALAQSLPMSPEGAVGLLRSFVAWPR